MPVQKKNLESSGLMATDFPQRKEPNYALGITISSMLALPQTRAFWPLSSVNTSAQPFDLSGQGRTLSNTGSVTFGVSGLCPYASFGGANYLNRADEGGLDITTALTLGGWFRAAALGTTQILISKYGAAGQRAYQLTLSSTGNMLMQVSTDGTAVVNAATTTTPFTALAWHFIAGRFTPSTEIAVWCDGLKVTNTVGIPATIFNSNADLIIGANVGGSNLTGYGALPFLCAAALSDAIVTNLYQQGRGIFGV